MIYEVNVERIRRQLNVLQTCADLIEEIDPNKKSRVDRFALERAYHLAVESMIDVGTVMIDGFIMRDPGGYLDIVDILEDEQVIPSKLSQRLKKQVNLRERLVRYYDEVDEIELYNYMQEIDLYREFINHVKTYILKELGEKIELKRV
ncbi:DUF86 domain-containing protein [Hazenella coriacea]|uniref:Uncharacterized protein YutE (UPF0331/DUF86 family) n=1 Tax=Hazenella coriacea TaxID=1179467 RepID=A0A4R3LAN9_9BACL|nr:DUF86 domain-containing protein [Hazenella coriacea]TCS96923.1 uncharacterized protein YutE (UPF0331/DUF86 family) [Hazenella coriacea]